MKKIILLAFSFYFIISSAAANTQCPPGQNYNSQVHRCLTSEQTAKIQQQVKTQCQGLSGSDFETCYIQTATESLQQDGIAETKDHQKGFVGSNTGLSIASIATLLSTRYLLTRNKQKDCKATSMRLAMYGGIASALGEVTSNVIYRHGLRRIARDYKGKVIGEKEEYKSDQERIEESQFNQEAAFDFLIEQEEKKRTALIMRGGAYAASAGFYTTAGIMTIIETIRSAKDPSVICPGSTNTNDNSPQQAQQTTSETAEATTTAGKRPSVEVGEPIRDTPFEGNFQAEHVTENGVPGVKDQNGKFWKKIDSPDGHPDFIDEDGQSIFKQQKAPPQSSIWAPSKINPFFNSYENYVTSLEFQESEFDRINREIIYLDIAFEKLLESLETNNKLNFASAVLNIITINKAYAQVDLSELEKGSLGGDILKEFKNMLIPAGSAFAASKIANEIAGDEVLNKAFTSPLGRGIYTGLLAGYSTAVSIDSFKKAGESKDRIEAIEKVKNSINKNPVTLAGCTVADRKDNKKPACYCYNDNNEPNLARSNQKICQTQWGDPSIAGLTDYNKNGTLSSNEKVCLSSTYRVDEGCSCRSTSGKNGCLQFGNTGAFDALGAKSFGKTISGLANDVTSGNYASGNALADAGRNLAMQSKKIEEKLAKSNPDAKKISDTISAQTSKLRQKHARDFANSGSPAMRSPLDTQPLGNIDPKKAAAEVEKSIAEAQAYEQGQAKKQASTSSDNNMNFDFGGNGSGGSIIVEDDMNEVMNKDFDYAENDINNRPGDSIFSILTLRYQTSGLRRLFDDKNEFQAEAASGNEIHGN